MKSFLKYTLATITGLFLASILFFIIFFMSMGLFMASADKPASIQENSILVLNTGMRIPDRGSNDPFGSFDPISFTMKPAPGLNNIVSNLEKASRDPFIDGVLIENGPMVNGWSTAREIREALLKFKESGKFVISYTDYYLTQQSYYISTAADKVYLNPVAIMEFKGIGSEVMFYKKALEKIGVEVQVVRHGRFKGAVEPYMGSSLSAENRMQIDRYINGIWNNVLSEISESRDISVKSLNNYADELATSDTKNAEKLSMIDGFLYRDELKHRLINLSHEEADKDPELVSMSKYSKVIVSGKPGSQNKIAVVYAEGTIVMGSGSSTNIGGKHYASTIRKIRENGNYSALVLRINSPGGNAMASDLIWREVDLTVQEMPVVVSMGNYAASGGYYIAAPADAIFAHPTTLTGSIGVFGMIPQGGKLLREKIGISTESVMTNKYADSPSLFRQMDSYETEIMQKNIDNTYNEFVSKVAGGRNMGKDDVDRLGEGHVFFGDDALENKLIDNLGGLSEAIAYAAYMAALDDYRIVELPEIEDPYTKLIKSLAGEVRSKIIKNELGVASAYYNDINEIIKMEGIQARIPYILKLK
jgi:protease-4